MMVYQTGVQDLIGDEIFCLLLRPPAKGLGVRSGR